MSEPQPSPPPTTECAVDDCPQPVAHRGWCVSHYNRHRRWGDPLGLPPARRMTEAVLVRLRLSVGVPASGPTPEMTAAWRRQEAQP